MKTKKFTLALIALTLFSFLSVIGQQIEPGVNRWIIDVDGSLTWTIDSRLPHADHLEMSGEKISAILNYEVTAEGNLKLRRSLIWPMLRSIPNKTRNHLARAFTDDIPSLIYVNDKPITDEKVKTVNFNGIMTVVSDFKQGIECTRTLFPSPTLPAYFEQYQLKNTTDKPVFIELPDYNRVTQTDAGKGIYGKYSIISKSIGGGSHHVDAGKSILLNIVYYATKAGEDFSAMNVEAEKKERQDRVRQWKEELILDTPDTLLNTAFSFAKIRGSESIYRTKGGLMHGPGGGAYYAAIWANDQAEYIGPFFPFLGYPIGNEASLNAYVHFARFMNPEYKAIPSSIIAEGENTWHGAKDRGDGAMIAYGASRYALALGDKKIAEQLWPLIEWCLEFCRRKVDKNGVVMSDSDELENRFPSGDANLCTSSLYYDALLSAAYLGRELGKSPQQISQYRAQAADMRKAIENHFGHKVEGFDTYRYYKGNDILRAWICIPLTVDIFDRKEGTIAALFSPRLWTNDGLATQAGDKTFWDRSTLYALRGVFAAGEKEKALQFLRYYSNRRLLGEHVPYPVEAYPEGGQRHLSAESGLYCRIYTEGLFGIRPIGLRSFRLSPQLPTEWDNMALRKIHAFGATFDLEVKREKDRLLVVVTSGGKKVFSSRLREGDSVEVKL